MRVKADSYPLPRRLWRVTVIMRQQSTDTLGAYTAQNARPPGALPANTDSASADTPATGRPDASTAGLLTPRPFHSTSPPYHGGPHRGRPDDGRARDIPQE